MNWKIGQKLVCVDGVNGSRDESVVGRPEPVVGEIYEWNGVYAEFPSVVYIGLVGFHPDSIFKRDMFRPVIDIGDEVEEYIKSKIQESEYA